MNTYVSLLACPKCKSELDLILGSLTCRKCEETYRIYENAPVFIDSFPENNLIITPTGYKKWIGKIASSVPAHTCWTDDTIFEFMNSLQDHTVLNLGSGSGLFDNKIRIPMINLDILKYANTDIIADAHHLPFKSDSIDCVFSNAVLEHVKRPWEVAWEITRVLKPGGYVAINLPFLNTIHDEHDYFRFTLKGIRELFPSFKELIGGVSSGGASFLPLATIQYLNLFVPFRILRSLNYFIWGHLFFRLKVLDKLVANKTDYAVTANSFYYIGQKPSLDLFDDKQSSEF